MHVYHRNNGRIYVWRDGVSAIVSDSAVSAGAAHHIAVWYESSTNTTYLMVDGVVQTGTFAANVFAITDPELWLGGQRYNGVEYNLYQGRMDEVALYDQPVNQGTFANHYANAGGGGTPPFTTETYGYDGNGNRTSLDDGTTVTALGYQSTTNRLTSVAGSAIVRDASGNRIAEPGGTRTYTYNNANRLSGVLDGGVTTAAYVHNALGQRTKKTVGGVDVIYLYDLSGNLIAEHDATGALIRDYVWMNGVPVAQIDTGEVFSYLHVDHLGTPRLATNDGQTVVWQWDGDAFGTSLPDEDPDGNGTGTTVNLRFAGQYFDGETGFFYNYHRTYDPSTGRYLESDPIGLLGGYNTYSYAFGNPTRYVDPYGLLCFDFDQFANQIRDNRADNALTLGSLFSMGAFGTMPKTPSELRGLGVPRSQLNQYTSQLSRWSQRFGIRALRELGRTAAGVAAGAAATVAVVGEGFYDIGVIGKAAYDATSNDDCECESTE